METQLKCSQHTLVTQTDISELALSKFVQLMSGNDHKHIYSYQWRTSAKKLAIPQNWEVTLHQTGFGLETTLSRVDGLLIQFELRGQHILLRIGGEETSHEKLVRHLQTLNPVALHVEENKVSFTFWHLTAHGAMQRTERLEVPAWPDIANNYAAGTRASLQHLTKSFVPESGGQMTLWHGPPGTGKTYAIRALAWEWRKWCRFDYITDPEVFFTRPGYMLEPLLDESFDDKREWRAVILEDTGEMLAADAKERTGQGLSRLLNLTDGLLGQAMKVILIITTNEPVSSFHPAVVRPGRCSAEVDFMPLAAHEAAVWGEMHGVDVPPGGHFPVAELFEMRSGKTIRMAGQREFGFAR